MRATLSSESFCHKNCDTAAWERVCSPKTPPEALRTPNWLVSLIWLSPPPPDSAQGDGCSLLEQLRQHWQRLRWSQLGHQRQRRLLPSLLALSSLCLNPSTRPGQRSPWKTSSSQAHTTTVPGWLLVLHCLPPPPGISQMPQCIQGPAKLSYDGDALLPDIQPSTRVEVESRA